MICAHLPCSNKFSENVAMDGTAYAQAPPRKRMYCSVTCSQRAAYRKMMSDYVWRLNKLLGMAKNRAAAKRLPFNIDLDHLVSLWESQGGVCAISNRAFDLTLVENSVNKDTPSLDRIHPHLGYVKGNVRIVTYHTNVALATYGADALEELCRDILGISYGA